MRHYWKPTTAIHSEQLVHQDGAIASSTASTRRVWVIEVTVQIPGALLQGELNPMVASRYAEIWSATKFDRLVLLDGLGRQLK